MAWNKRHPDRFKKSNRNHRLRKNYGIDVAAWERMLASQGGRCAICRCAPTDKDLRRFNVDHSHETGEVRGILCHGCNVALGLLRDNQGILQSAIDYLDRYKSK